MWFLASPIAFTKLLFPWYTCFCFIRSLIFCKSAAVINHKFQGTQILLNIQKQSHRDFLQTCNEFTGEHPRICVVFTNLNCRFGCSPVNLLHICRIPFAILSENLWETSLWIFFTLFSQLIFNFTRFVIQVKENLYAYNLASLTNENKYICRFDASFFVLRPLAPRDALWKIAVVKVLT